MWERYEDIIGMCENLCCGVRIVHHGSEGYSSSGSCVLVITFRELEDLRNRLVRVDHIHCDM